MGNRVIFLREGNLETDSRAMKELLVIGKRFDVLILGMREGEFDGTYEFGEESFTSQNMIVTYSSKVGHLWSLLKYYFFVLFALKNRKKDTNFVYAVNMWLGLVALVANKSFGIPYVYDVYDSLAFVRKYPNVLKKLLISIETLVVNNSVTTFIASDERRLQLKNVDQSKVVVIYNSPQINDEFRSYPRRGGDLFRIVYIGGLSQDRSLPNLLKAVSELSEFELVIGGDGSLRHLVESFSNKFKNIEFVGPQRYENVLKYEAQADALTALYDPDVPNHKFASPNKFFEAFALGKPLIMYQDTGMDKLVMQNGAGVVFDDTSVFGIKNALINLKRKFGIENHSVANKMTEVFDSEFSWTMMADRIDKVILQIGISNNEKN